MVRESENYSQKILLVCSKISNSDGIGRHALALSEQFRRAGFEVSHLTIKPGSYLDKVQQFCSRFFLRHIFDLGFMLVASCFTKLYYCSYRSVSPSVICGLGTNQIHFSSCHLHSLSVAGERWKLYFSPRNLFYVAAELYQYKRCKQAIFISRQQAEQFKDYYGHRKRPSFVLPPVLNSINFRADHSNQDFGYNFFNKKRKKFLFSGYNFRLKGLRIAQLAISNINGELDIVGNDAKYKPLEVKNGIHRFLGPMKFSDINWSEYGFFIFPTHSDSYAFVIQEAVRNGLIPICSSQAGGSEVLADYGFSECVIEQKPKVMEIDFESIALEYSSAINRWLTMDQQSRTFNVSSSQIYNEDVYNKYLVDALFDKHRGSQQ